MQRGERTLPAPPRDGGSGAPFPAAARPSAGDHADVMTARLDGGGSDRARVVCGFLGCDARPFNPLLAALPRLLHMPGAAAKGGFLGHFINVAVEEANLKRPGGEAVLERLSEMMFVDVVRRYLEALPPEQTGWLAGLRDRFVGRALGLLHERPSHHWTIDEIGDAVGLSRSALHERFAHLVGQPPMQYLAQWRMQVASQLLLQSTMNVASIALETGYESEAAFSRAFKRLVGVPPATWRRQRAASGAAATKRPATQNAPRAPA
jgi:AraC-like DNA-binding protein